MKSSEVWKRRFMNVVLKPHVRGLLHPEVSAVKRQLCCGPHAGVKAPRQLSNTSPSSDKLTSASSLLWCRCKQESRQKRSWRKRKDRRRAAPLCLSHKLLWRSTRQPYIGNTGSSCANILYFFFSFFVSHSRVLTQLAMLFKAIMNMYESICVLNSRCVKVSCVGCLQTPAVSSVGAAFWKMRAVHSKLRLRDLGQFRRGHRELRTKPGERRQGFLQRGPRFGQSGKNRCIS